MPNYRVLSIRTLVSVSGSQIEDCWQGLQNVFHLPEFDLLQDNQRLIEWRKQAKIARSTANQRLPRFMFEMGESDPSIHILTGVSNRQIIIRWTEDNRHYLGVEFGKASFYCAAKVLDLLPTGIDLEIDALMGDECSTILWRTGDQLPDGLVVDRDIKSPREIEQETPSDPPELVLV